MGGWFSSPEPEPQMSASDMSAALDRLEEERQKLEDERKKLEEQRMSIGMTDMEMKMMSMRMLEREKRLMNVLDRINKQRVGMGLSPVSINDLRRMRHSGRFARRMVRRPAITGPGIPLSVRQLQRRV